MNQAESSSEGVVTGVAPVTADADMTAQITLGSLSADQSYRVEVRCTNGRGVSGQRQVATFRTAPEATLSRSTTFLVSGDLGGQTYCRLQDGGYPIFRPMTELATDFFVANGDMIYADNACPERGAEGKLYLDGGFPGVGDPSVDWTDRSQVDEVYRAHWKYNRADPALQRFLKRTPLYVQWDDHEVINDFGAPWPFHLPAPERSGYPTLVESGRQTFFDYHPVVIHEDEPGRIYRSFRWGRELELFLIDARSYRSRNDRIDEPDDAGNAKTMLGKAQLGWLIEGLSNSDAVWKVVSSDVPLSIPTGSGASAFGRDAFASGSTPFGSRPDFAARTGFESELLWLLGELDRNDVTNLVFVATDVHYATQMRYERDFNGDRDTLRFFELVSGPLSAVKNPSPPALDPTLGPVVLYAEGGIFNFAYIRIEALVDGARLVTDVRDETGKVRPGSPLVIEPE